MAARATHETRADKACARSRSLGSIAPCALKRKGRKHNFNSFAPFHHFNRGLDARTATPKDIKTTPKC
jgi:hypothetical protein